MKRIFAKSTLKTYWEKHLETEQYLKTWYEMPMRISITPTSNE